MKNINTKFAALNLVKASMIVLLILSCISFAGCGKTDEVDTDKVGTLIQWLKDEDKSVRVLAAEELGEIKDTRAVEPLIAALRDNNSTVRWSAAEALGKIKDARAVGPLIDALEDDDNGVRREAIKALEVLEEIDGNQR